MSHFLFEGTLSRRERRPVRQKKAEPPGDKPSGLRSLRGLIEKDQVPLDGPDQEMRKTNLSGQTRPDHLIISFEWALKRRNAASSWEMPVGLGTTYNGLGWHWHPIRSLRQMEVQMNHHEPPNLGHFCHLHSHLL